MKLRVKIELLKFCSTVFNSIFLVLGLSVVGCAVWILFGTGSFLNVVSSEDLQVVGAGLLLIGGVVTVVSVVGCVAANSENRFLLLVYLGFLIVLVLGQLFIILLLLINRDKIVRSLDEAVEQIILSYGDNSNNTNNNGLMDSVQHSAGCCGMAGPADWLRNSYIQSLNLTGPDVLPCSCFSSFRRSSNSSWCSELLNFTEPLYGRGNGSFGQGCSQKISVWLQENGLTIVGMDLSLMFIQVLQFVLAMYLYRAFGQKASLKKNHLLDNHAHPDHAPDDDLDDGEQNYAFIDPDGGYADPAHLVYHPDNQTHSQVQVR